LVKIEEEVGTNPAKGCAPKPPARNKGEKKKKKRGWGGIRSEKGWGFAGGGKRKSGKRNGKKKTGKELIAEEQGGGSSKGVNVKVVKKVSFLLLQPVTEKTNKVKGDPQ